MNWISVVCSRWTGIKMISVFLCFAHAVKNNFPHQRKGSLLHIHNIYSIRKLVIILCLQSLVLWLIIFVQPHEYDSKKQWIWQKKQLDLRAKNNSWIWQQKIRVPTGRGTAQIVYTIIIYIYTCIYHTNGIYPYTILITHTCHN